METATFPWDGVRSERIEIRVTPAELEEIRDICQKSGGISMITYFRTLHHKAMGRLKEGGVS